MWSSHPVRVVCKHAVYHRDALSTYCDDKDYRHLIRACRHPPLAPHTYIQNTHQQWRNSLNPILNNVQYSTPQCQPMQCFNSLKCGMNLLLKWWVCLFPLVLVELIIWVETFFSLHLLSPRYVAHPRYGIARLSLRLHRNSSSKQCGICRCVYTARPWCKQSLKVGAGCVHSSTWWMSAGVLRGGGYQRPECLTLGPRLACSLSACHSDVVAVMFLPVLFLFLFFFFLLLVLMFF